MLKKFLSEYLKRKSVQSFQNANYLLRPGADLSLNYGMNFNYWCSRNLVTHLYKSNSTSGRQICSDGSIIITKLKFGNNIMLQGRVDMLYIIANFL